MSFPGPPARGRNSRAIGRRRRSPLQCRRRDRRLPDVEGHEKCPMVQHGLPSPRIDRTYRAVRKAFIIAKERGPHVRCACAHRQPNPDEGVPPMPTYLSPGVYMEEVSSGSKPIEGVGTAVAAFVGFAEKGAVNEPTLVTNWTQFTQNFGDFVEGSYLAHAVYGYFLNGGGSAYVVRIGAEGD